MTVYAFSTKNLLNFVSGFLITKKGTKPPQSGKPVLIKLIFTSKTTKFNFEIYFR